LFSIKKDLEFYSTENKYKLSILFPQTNKTRIFLMLD